MKLIDILVQELPKLGGWPIGADRIYQNAKGHLVGVQGCIISPVDMELAILAEDLHKSVAHEQYEAALASSKQEWDGEGLPPVGCVCEVRVCEGFEKCEIVFSHPKSGVAYIYLDENEHGGKRPVDCISPIPAPSYFRPIRSEADKKRDEAIFAIAELCRGSASNGHSAELIYDAIKSGKIVID